MSVQQKLLERLGNALVLKYKAAAATRSATGKTAASIYAVATDNSLDIRGAAYIGVLEYGRKKTRPDAPEGSPTLFEAIREWAIAKGVVTSAEKGSKGLGIVYAITRKIHKKGTLLNYTTDRYGKTKPSGVISDVTNSLSLDELTREVTALHVSEYSSEVLKSLKGLQ